ncbi:hypothetical protein BLNAU_20614 [Blattamonas nauphoetae]|uniref:Uncharacterized protein n=1 Tax=Blattamonas nauphoetae TaxID=2049346 RepID=A0ABQ9WY69_9EUKA|nr:hypothetical protein BLNAU_20614 [Blattamonas nauphoetae]
MFKRESLNLLNVARLRTYTRALEHELDRILAILARLKTGMELFAHNLSPRQRPPFAALYVLLSERSSGLGQTPTSCMMESKSPQLSLQEDHSDVELEEQDLVTSHQPTALRSLSQQNPSTVFIETRMGLRQHPPRTVYQDFETSVDSPPLDAPLSNSSFNSFLNAIHSGAYLTWGLEEMEATVVRGEFILFNEHRLLPCDKRTAFRYFNQVFQQNKIPEYKMYQMTKVMVHQANIRTDVCSVCVVGDQLRTQGRKLAEETRLDLTECIRRHNEDNIFQRIKHNADIADLHGNECVIVADFKENLNLPMGRTQVGESFYSRAPVQMLTFVLFRRVGAKIQQRVFTVLSRTLSKSSAFVKHALQSVLMDKSFSTVTTMKWWSDGAPHFHSREFVSFLLVDLRIHNREIETQVNFFYPQHGKNCCDRVFAKYSRLLTRHPSPINDFTTLIQVLKQKANTASKHFKMSLFFSRSHDKIYAAPISDTTILKLSSIAVLKTKAKRLTTKLSTVPDTMTDAFEDEEPVQELCILIYEDVRAEIFTVGSVFAFIISIASVFADIFSIASVFAVIFSIASVFAVIFSIASVFAFIFSIASVFAVIFSIASVFAVIFSIASVFAFIFSIASVFAVIFSIASVFAVIFSIASVFAVIFSIASVFAFIFSIASVFAVIFSIASVFAVIFSIASVFAVIVSIASVFAFIFSIASVLADIFSSASVFAVIFSIASVFAFIFSIASVFAVIFSIASVFAVIFSIASVFAVIFSIASVFAFIFSIASVFADIFSIASVFAVIFSIASVFAVIFSIASVFAVIFSIASVFAVIFSIASVFAFIFSIASVFAVIFSIASVFAVIFSIASVFAFIFSIASVFAVIFSIASVFAVIFSIASVFAVIFSIASVFAFIFSIASVFADIFSIASVFAVIFSIASVFAVIFSIASVFAVIFSIASVFAVIFSIASVFAFIFSIASVFAVIFSIASVFAVIFSIASVFAVIFSIASVFAFIFSIASVFADIFSIASVLAVIFSIASVFAFIFSIASVFAVIFSIASVFAVIFSIASVFAVIFSIASVFAVIFSIASVFAVIFSIASVFAVIFSIASEIAAIFSFPFEFAVIPIAGIKYFVVVNFPFVFAVTPIASIKYFVVVNFPFVFAVTPIASIKYFVVVNFPFVFAVTPIASIKYFVVVNFPFVFAVTPIATKAQELRTTPREPDTFKDGPKLTSQNSPLTEPSAESYRLREELSFWFRIYVVYVDWEVRAATRHLWGSVEPNLRVLCSSHCCVRLLHPIHRHLQPRTETITTFAVRRAMQTNTTTGISQRSWEVNKAQSKRMHSTSPNSSSGSTEWAKKGGVVISASARKHPIPVKSLQMNTEEGDTTPHHLSLKLIHDLVGNERMAYFGLSVEATILFDSVLTVVGGDFGDDTLFFGYENGKCSATKFTSGALIKLFRTLEKPLSNVSLRSGGHTRHYHSREGADLLRYVVTSRALSATATLTTIVAEGKVGGESREEDERKALLMKKALAGSHSVKKRKKKDGQAGGVLGEGGEGREGGERMRSVWVIPVYSSGASRVTTILLRSTARGRGMDGVWD